MRKSRKLSSQSVKVIEKDDRVVKEEKTEFDSSLEK
jgi:hypothetical protein